MYASSVLHDFHGIDLDSVTRKVINPNTNVVLQRVPGCGSLHEECRISNRLLASKLVNLHIFSSNDKFNIRLILMYTCISR